MPQPPTPDISALLSGIEFEMFKKRIGFFLFATGYKRYLLTFAYGTKLVVWMCGDTEAALDRLMELYAYDHIQVTDTEAFSRFDKVILQKDDTPV